MPIFHFNLYDLTLFLPMAVAGALLVGGIPVATRTTRYGLRAAGARPVRWPERSLHSLSWRRCPCSYSRPTRSTASNNGRSLARGARGERFSRTFFRISRRDPAIDHRKR